MSTLLRNVRAHGVSGKAIDELAFILNHTQEIRETVAAKNSPIIEGDGAQSLHTSCSSKLRTLKDEMTPLTSGLVPTVSVPFTHACPLSVNLVAPGARRHSRPRAKTSRRNLNPWLAFVSTNVLS